MSPHCENTHITPKLTVISDYDGFFESLVRRWLAELRTPPKHREILISAGPYRAQAVEVLESKDKQSIHLDFYSALRAGFGSLSDLDEARIKEML